MFESLSGFLSTLRQTTPVILLGLAFGTGIILFISEGAATTLGLNELRDQYRGKLGALFIISASIMVAQACLAIGKKISLLYNRLQKEKKARQQLHDLTPDEKSYLAPYDLAPK